jgi:hypothetical protein
VEEGRNRSGLRTEMILVNIMLPFLQPDFTNNL